MPINMSDPAVTLRFMAEWPPSAIDEEERAALLAGAEALEELGRLRALDLEEDGG